MNAQPKTGSRRLDASELESLREIWVFLVGMGLALVILGIAAIGSSLIATFATVMVFGILLLLGGIFEIVTAIWGRHWQGFALHLLAGGLYSIAGVFLIENPLPGAIGLTLLVAACLLAAGAVRIALSVVGRFDGWGWVLLNGIISLILGIAIWSQWPFSGLWVIGFFVGIEMLCSGLSWVMFGLTLRSTPKRTLPV